MWLWFSSEHLRALAVDRAFMHFMSELKLDYPRKILEAVPANLQCGLRGSSMGGHESHQDAALDI